MATTPTIRPFTGGEVAGYGTSQRGNDPAQKVYQAGLYNGKMLNTPEEYDAATNTAGSSSLPNIQQMSTIGTQGRVNPSGLYQNPGQIGSQPNSGNPVAPQQDVMGQNPHPTISFPNVSSPGQSTSPTIGMGGMPTGGINNGSPINSVGQPASFAQPDLSQKYNQAFQQATENNGAAPQSAAEARPMVSQATSQYQPPQQQYQPTPQFMQVGDPIMKTFVQAAMMYQNDVIQSGYAAKYMQAQFSNAVQGIDLQAANVQNIMNGTRDDIRAEIGKTGGFATESQVEGLVTTRNRDLLKQYNNIELQKQTMQNQMQLQVGLANADHQFAVDKFDNLTKTATLYKGIYDNTTDQVNKAVASVGADNLASYYNNDPYFISVAEQHLGMPQGTLTNPAFRQNVKSFRERSLALSANRFTANYGYTPNGTQPNVSNISPNSTNGGNERPVSPEGTNPAGTSSYAQYGLLANTDFNPLNPVDKNAQNYIDAVFNGTQPSKASDIGISVKGASAGTQFNDAKTRAENLYYAATGQNLPNPDIITNNRDLINANNKLANQLKVQENTVNANFGLSLQNLNANNLNTAWPILNGAINNIKNAEGDPAVAQYLTQNSTIQQELGNLLAVKNASGTTVHDKIAGAGLMPSNATPAQQVAIVKVLLQEAKNASNAFSQVNGDLYRTIDPLERQANNPNRYSTTKSGKHFDYLKAKNSGYSDKAIEDYINSN